ncbi:MAG: hypothetical protein AAF869_01030 [Pseudomonadota bacterium]
MMRIIAVVALGLFAVAAVARYQTEIEAKSAEAELKRLERQIAREERRIVLLRAELAHLEDPERLRRLAAAHTGLQAARVDQLADMPTAVKRVQAGAPAAHTATQTAPQPASEPAADAAPVPAIAAAPPEAAPTRAPAPRIVLASASADLADDPIARLLARKSKRENERP